MFKVFITTVVIVSLSGSVFSQVVRNLEGRYSIRKLRSWELKTDSTKTVIFENNAKRNDVYNENLQINVYPANGLDLNGFFETYFTTNLPLILQEYQELEKRDEFLNGQPVKILKFSHTFEETLMTSMAFVFLKNNKIYYIFAMSTKEEFDKYDSFFINMVSTFRIF